MKHDLFPASVRASLPALYSQENVENPMVLLKFFTPCSNWTWYVLEGDPLEEDADDYLFFALVQGAYEELGYVRLKDMQTNGIERDYHFRPKPLSEVRNPL